MTLGPRLIITTTVGAAALMAVATVLLLVGAAVVLLRLHRRALAQAREQEREAAAAAQARLLLRLDHELKNPLTALQAAAGSAAQLAGSVDGDRTDEAGLQASVTTIGSSSRRIARLLADLRQLADIETREISLRPVDVGALLELVVEDAGTAPGAAERTINVSVPRAPWPLPHVLGDEDLLHTAVLNLLVNAVKYSQPGDVIEVRAVEEAERWVAVDVADTGLGIPDAEQEAVWDELARGSQVRSVPGSGMGLALVRAIVARHGGTVRLRSRLDEGTSVSLLFPAVRGQP